MGGEANGEYLPSACRTSFGAVKIEQIEVAAVSAEGERHSTGWLAVHCLISSLIFHPS